MGAEDFCGLARGAIECGILRPRKKAFAGLWTLEKRYRDAPDTRIQCFFELFAEIEEKAGYLRSIRIFEWMLLNGRAYWNPEAGESIGLGPKLGRVG
jgi:hypothetical protein